jgi:serine/threonine-protein kinase HipA
MLQHGYVRLAPLYDLLSTLPYKKQMTYRKLKLAMRVDREYLVWKIRKRHWEGLALGCGLDPRPVVERADELLAAIPDAARTTAAKLKGEGLPSESVDLIEQTIAEHSQERLVVLGTE